MLCRVSQERPTPLGRASAILLVSVGSPDPVLVRSLTNRIAAVFQVPVFVYDVQCDWRKSYNVGRGQYNATDILRALDALCPRADVKVLAITELDLCNPVLSFVYGEAVLGGNVAVVSSHRLSPTIYRNEWNVDRLARRLETEAIHELGHTWGLLHCRCRSCVMCASYAVHEIDEKNPGFCRSCMSELRHKPGESVSV